MERRARDLDSNSISPTELSCHLRPLSLVASSKNFNEGISEMLGDENNVCQEALCEQNQCVILLLFYNVFTPFLSGPVFMKTIQITEKLMVEYLEAQRHPGGLNRNFSSE